MKRAILVLLLVTVTTGCSTVTRGSRQDVQVKTTPPGALARINTQQCFTPCTLQNVHRKSDTIYLTNAGTEKPYQLDRSFNFWTTIAGNWWNYFWPGIVVDAISGAMFSIEDINMDLEPKAAIEVSSVAP